MPLWRLLALVLFALLAARPLAAQPQGDLDELARDVERVESLRAIKTLQRSYAQYAQYGLWNEIGALFAPGAQFTFDGQIRQGQTMAGPVEIAAFLRSRYGGGHEGLEAGDTRLTMIEAPVVMLAPNGREATGRWSVLTFLGGKGRAAIEGGIFVNDYRKGDDGKWRIAGARYFPQYSGPYETGWTNWGGGDLPIVPYHFTPDDAGVPVMAPEGEAPATQATLADLSARIRLLNDEDTVRNLQAALGFYLDRKMWDDVVDMFAEDGKAEIAGVGEFDGKAGIRRWLEQAMGPAGLTHGQLNDRPQFDVTVAVSPDGRQAWVRGIELGMLGEADQEKGWWEGAAFRNLFVNEGGVWKVKEVHRFPLFRSDYDLGWGADLSAHPATAQMQAFLGPHPVTGEAVGPAAGAELVMPRPLASGLASAASPLTLEEARTALRRSLAYDSIENVSSAYGDFLDDFQSENFSALLARDGFKMSAFAGYYIGRDRVTEAGRRVWGPAPETRPGISFHWRVQPVILVSDDGRSANQRVRLFQPRTGKEVSGNGFYGAYFYSGMYHDQYVLEDGVWRMWNLSLDEPYMSNVAWKTGWARAKDPVAPPQGATSVLVRDDSDFKPDVPVKELGERQLHFRGGTGDPWQWPTILPMWFEYRNPVSGRVPEHFQEFCAPCTARPDLRLDRHGYQQPPTWPQGAPAAPPATTEFTFDSARIDAMLHSMVDTGRVAGAEVLVWKDGREAYYGSAGLRRVERPAPFARDTQVQLFSMTKPVTGVALMQLWEQGRFGLDDPLSRHLPQFAEVQVYDEAEPDKLRPPARAITIRDVLRHTAGFTYGNASHPTDPLWNELNPLSPDHTLAQFAELMPKVPLLYDPGTHWHYSAGVDVQARLVEVLSGQPFDEYVRDHIFRPLGMEHSCWKCGDEFLDNLASIYSVPEPGRFVPMPDAEWLGPNFSDKPMTMGGSGIVSTIDDYMRFARMLLNGGELDGARILQPATVRLMSTDQLDPRIEDKDRLWLPGKGNGGFGFDFFVRTGPPKDAQELRGAIGEFYWDGYPSMLFWVDPANDMAVVFAAQKIPIDVSLHRDIRAAVYGADYDGR